ncbi:hypothetical protein TKK_0015321 [Trichogramma kaykai]
MTCRKGGGKWAKGKNQNKKPYKKPKGSPSKKHITNKGFLLSSFNKCDGEITCANKNADANILIDGKGTLILKSRVDGKNIELSNVISVPDVCENLMSLRKFVDSGYSIYLDDETITISDKNTEEKYLTGILITNTENTYENTDAIEQFTIESDPIKFVSQSETNKVVQSNIDSNTEIEVPQIPENTRKRKPECVPKVLPERRAKKIKLQHPDFVYRIKQIDYLPSDIEIHANLAEVNRDPVSYKQAMESAQKAEWLNAINEESKSMKENKVWNIIDKPERNSDGSKLNLIDSK